jgi:hypothetical protein
MSLADPAGASRLLHQHRRSGLHTRASTPAVYRDDCGATVSHLGRGALRERSPLVVRARNRLGSPGFRLPNHARISRSLRRSDFQRRRPRGPIRARDRAPHRPALLASHARGRWFEPSRAHRIKAPHDSAQPRTSHSRKPHRTGPTSRSRSSRARNDPQALVGPSVRIDPSMGRRSSARASFLPRARRGGAACIPRMSSARTQRRARRLAGRDCLTRGPAGLWEGPPGPQAQPARGSPPPRQARRRRRHAALALRARSARRR